MKNRVKMTKKWSKNKIKKIPHKKKLPKIILWQTKKLHQESKSNLQNNKK